MAADPGGRVVDGGNGDWGTYDEALSAAIARCEGINPSEYQSGLLFNPEGYRSYYVRSQCFQTAAVQFRDDALCNQVKRRRALFSSSWGYSRSRCIELVREGVATDRGALEDMKRLYARGGMRLRDFRVERNGNARDFDIIPSFGGDYAHGYRLMIEILQAMAGPPRPVHSSGYYVDATSNLRIFVRQAEIRAQFPDFALGTPYRMRAVLVLDVGSGGQDGFWSDSFIERVFPLSDRSHAIIKEVVF